MVDSNGFSHRREAQLWGMVAEWFAFLLLFAKGYSILERNWRCPLGEIDLIARYRETVVFVEVKARASKMQAMEAITAHQRARIQNAAGVWMASHPKSATSGIRFDCVVVTPWTWPQHIENAWQT